MAIKDPKSDFVQSLDSVVGSELGIDMRCLTGFDIYWSNLAASSILRLLKDFGPFENAIAGHENAKVSRQNTIKVIEAVSGTLGLDGSALAWGCAVVLLKVPQL